MNSAYEQVTGNRGAAGVDGIGVNDFAEQIKSDWTLIKSQLESGIYEPKTVKRVEIPKGSGGVRLLGIPTYMDRLIQQAISQVLVKVYDPEFSATSYGFRSEKNAHQALARPGSISILAIAMLLIWICLSFSTGSITTT